MSFIEKTLKKKVGSVIEEKMFFRLFIFSSSLILVDLFSRAIFKANFFSEYQKKSTLYIITDEKIDRAREKYRFRRLIVDRLIDI